MTSRNMKRFAASRGAALVLACVLVLGFGLTAGAQSVNAESPNGLEGTWRAQLTVLDCTTGVALRPTFPTIWEYAKGGMLTVTTAGQLPSVSTTGLGVWNHMYGHTYSAVSESFIFDSAGAFTIHRVTHVIEVDANRYKDTIALEILDTNWNLIATGGCGTVVGSRMK